VVVGAGPQLAHLKRRFGDATFTGERHGEDLALCYASADVFVFPSRTDTFGMVLLEAMASGLPIAAFPVTGPLDLVTEGVSGVLSDNLGEAALSALRLDRGEVRSRALEFSWENAARLFLANVEASLSRRPVALAAGPLPPHASSMA
jgi:glycosyltransferase involved in cell wall biosynthesis